MAQKNKKFSSNVFGGGLAAAQAASAGGGAVPVRKPNSAIYSGGGSPQPTTPPVKQPSANYKPVNSALNLNNQPASPGRNSPTVYSPKQPSGPPTCDVINRQVPVASFGPGSCKKCGSSNPSHAKFCCGCGDIIALSGGSQTFSPAEPEARVAPSINELDVEEMERREEERMLKKLGNTGVALI